MGGGLRHAQNMRWGRWKKENSGGKKRRGCLVRLRKAEKKGAKLSVPGLEKTGVRAKKSHGQGGRPGDLGPRGGGSTTVKTEKTPTCLG